MKILVATNNTHKVEELRNLINLPNFELFTMKDLNINLNTGLNVFTGETGAGKTLIIDSLKNGDFGDIGKVLILATEDGIDNLREHLKDRDGMWCA